MKTATLIVALLMLFPFARAFAASDEKCELAPLSAADLGAGPDAINEALLCLQRRIEALEGSDADAPAKEKPAANTLSFGDLELTMDYAAVVDNRQVVLELLVVNSGKEPVLAMIDDHNSAIMLRGEAEPRKPEIQGFASCGRKGMNARDRTAACIEKSSEHDGTALEPGVPYELRLAGSGRRAVKGDSVSAKIRMLTKTGDGWEKKDLSFARVPLHR